MWFKTKVWKISIWKKKQTASLWYMIQLYIILKENGGMGVNQQGDTEVKLKSMLLAPWDMEDL